MAGPPSQVINDQPLIIPQSSSPKSKFLNFFPCTQSVITCHPCTHFDAYLHSRMLRLNTLAYTTLISIEFHLLSRCFFLVYYPMWFSWHLIFKLIATQSLNCIIPWCPGEMGCRASWEGCKLLSTSLPQFSACHAGIRRYPWWQGNYYLK